MSSWARLGQERPSSGPQTSDTPTGSEASASGPVLCLGHQMKEIPLRSRKYPGLVTLVDDDVYEWAIELELYPNRLRHVWYARVPNKYGAPHLLHSRIMGVSGVDHINHDGLDNRRKNLRPATASQNGANRRRIASGGTSRFKGVYYDSTYHTWRAHIRKDGHKISRTFRDELTAARWYNDQATRLFGEYAFLNEI